MMEEKTRPNKIELDCDDLDFAVIQRAVAIRQKMRVFPPTGSNVSGAVVAEICRGWLDFMGLAIRPDVGNEPPEATNR